jgi:2-polyprenyl-3-methyl-5-hydroxy-6-metoxy-1,4-benzoquinol methylase
MEFLAMRRMSDGMARPATGGNRTERHLSAQLLRLQQVANGHPDRAQGQVGIGSNQVQQLPAADPSSRSFLDIGCGDGRYLDLFERRGIPKDRIYGLDLADEQVRQLCRRGYRAYRRRVEDCSEIPAGSIDLATMFHVIEHVADPVRVVRKIAEWLSPGGALVIETPSLDSWDARLFKRQWWGNYHIPRHWTLFDAGTLRRLLEACGLTVRYCAYQTGHGSWMNSFHHVAKYNSRLPSPALASWFELPKGLPMLVAFTGLDIVRKAFGARTSVILMMGQKVDGSACGS